MGNNGMRHQVIRAGLASSLILGTTMGLSASAWAQPIATQTLAASSDSQSRLVEFNIPAQPLGKAVIVFAEQAGIEVFFDSSKLAGLQSGAVTGRHSPRQALDLLLGSLPVSYNFVGENRVSLERLKTAGAVELGATHIEGARKDDWIYQTPRSVSVVSREQIDRHPPRHAADMLQDTAGVYTSTSYQEPGLSVNIRGVQDYGRVNMSIDGARQNFQQSGHQQRNGEVFVDPELLSGIEISKGPNSGMGGAGVIGGTANFRTLDINDIVKPERDEGVRLRGSTGLGGYANGNHFAGSLAAGLRASEKIELLAAFSRKRMGEYSPGSRGDSYAASSTFSGNRYRDVVTLSDQDMDSQLFKVYWHMADGHELKLTHLATEVNYTSAGTYDPSRNEDGWESVTRNEVTSSTTSVDYTLNDGDPWIDLAAKLYFARTRNHQDADAVAPDYSGITNPGLLIFCRNNPTNTSVCPQGSDAYTLTTETRTWGLNLQNTSRFKVPMFDVSWNYGSELSYDKTVPKSEGVESVDSYGNETAGTTPPGQRWLTSLFTNLTLEHNDWLRVDAGLRYDRYRLWGDTGFTSLDSRGEITGVPNTRIPIEYSVDDQRGHLSPTFALAITPVQGVQLYANYGEGWRPPAITESLISGQHIGTNDGTIMLPNPYLKAEESKTWETGVNLKFDDLISGGDTFRAKLAYFNTKIENYIRLANVGRPGAAFSSLTHYAPVNMLDPVRLRGFELEAEYDAGPWYLKGNATRVDYHTGRNSYRLFYLGGAQGATADYWNNFIAGDGTGQGFTFYSMFPPRDTASLSGGLRFFDRSLELGSRLRYASENESNSITQGSLAYSVVDLFSSLRATENLTLRLSVENVRDRRYLVPMGDLLARTEGPGRTVIGSFELTF